MNHSRGKFSRAREAIFLVAMLAGLYLTTFYSYLLFHSVAEVFSIVIAACIFVIGWNTRQVADNGFFSVISGACLAIGIIDFVHTLAYKGMNIFGGYGSNLATQLWIIARFLQSLSLLVALFVTRRKVDPRKVLGFLLPLTVLLLVLIFAGSFPTCYVEGVGLTPFKIGSEYIICGILVVVLIFLRRKREDFEKPTFVLLGWAIIATVCAELAFTFYVGVYDFSNLVGHLFKVLSFYFLYKALVQESLVHPTAVLFRNLRRQESEARRQMQDAEQKLGEMVNAKQAAELASSAKSIFLANMSHELRTPLNAIMGFSEILRDSLLGPVTREQQDGLNDIIKSGEYLTALINDLLDLSKIEAGKIQLEMGEFSLKDVLESSVRLLHEKAARHQIGVQVEIPENLKPIHADERRCKQVVFNLLSNALKYTPDRGKVGIKVIDAPNVVQVTVWDTGIGIADENIGKLFLPFSRIDTPYNKDVQGTGLGLCFSKKLVEIHGGRIWAESQPGKGSQFHFTIPRRPSP